MTYKSEKKKVRKNVILVEWMFLSFWRNTYLSLWSRRRFRMPACDCPVTLITVAELGIYMCACLKVELEILFYSFLLEMASLFLLAKINVPFILNSWERKERGH